MMFFIPISQDLKKVITIFEKKLFFFQKKADYLKRQPAVIQFYINSYTVFFSFGDRSRCYFSTTGWCPNN